MSSREGVAGPASAQVLSQRRLSEHLMRLEVACPQEFVSTGIPDEWVALTIPGQFQTRYYTVRSICGAKLTFDVVLHKEGLLTEWAQGECVGDELGVGLPKGSYAPAPEADWIVLVGDLTALPAMARISEAAVTDPRPVTAYVESPDGPIEGYLPDRVLTTWLEPPGEGRSALAEVVRGIRWPAGEGYLWMAGESAQMRDIRRHVRRDLGWATSTYDVMGYWSGSRGRQARAADPAPQSRSRSSQGD